VAISSEKIRNLLKKVEVTGKGSSIRKCPKCGYERQEKDDQHEIIPTTDCPKCGAIYKISEREIEAQRERYRKHLEDCKRKEREEKVEIQEQQANYRKDLEEREKETQQQQPAVENIGWFRKKSIEATTKNIIQGIVKAVDFKLRENPSLSLEEALNAVNINIGITPEEKNIVTDLNSLFGIMVWKTYLYESALNCKTFSKGEFMLVVQIAYDYMDMVRTNSGALHTASGSKDASIGAPFISHNNGAVPDRQINLNSATQDKMDQRPWYAGIGTVILIILLRNC
jgi:transcription elongation factor Elf1